MHIFWGNAIGETDSLVIILVCLKILPLGTSRKHPWDLICLSDWTVTCNIQSQKARSKDAYSVRTELTVIRERVVDERKKFVYKWMREIDKSPATCTTSRATVQTLVAVLSPQRPLFDPWATHDVSETKRHWNRYFNLHNHLSLSHRPIIIHLSSGTSTIGHWAPIMPWEWVCDPLFGELIATF